MIDIRKMTEETKSLLWTIEDRRLDSEKVVIRAKQGGFELDYKPLPGALWRVGNAEQDVPGDAQSWLEDANKEVFFGWMDGALAGQILVELDENNLVRIRDIRVQLAMRRRGMGEAMVALAEDWARGRDRGGLTAETQDGNAGACQFWKRRGFELGGIDTLRYVAKSKQALQAAGLRETALSFYKFFR